MKVQRLAQTDTYRWLQRAQRVSPEVQEAALRIIEDVRIGGDDALLDLTEQLDGVRLTSPWLEPVAWRGAADACPEDTRRAIDANMARIEAFHTRQVAAEDTFEVEPGITLGRRPVPYRAVACYVPGGRASYPSTVLMTVVPARLAGVQDIIVVTPPRDGGLDPAVAYAAQVAGAHRILLAGGAQAIAAVVCGTQSVPPVASIVGPGNAYVTAAKQILSDRVRIDSPAGPSELLVLADATADAEHVALDLVAQAEHDPDAQVLLVTDDEALAQAVAAKVADIADATPRKAIVQRSLQNGAIFVADAWEDALAFADAYAPEHLEIISKDPGADLDRIHDAGSVFLGPWAPVSLGDYGSGTNHVLPTMGFARLTGGLSVDNFRKWITWQEVTREGLAAVATDIIDLAEAEGLHGHAEAVRRRL